MDEVWVGFSVSSDVIIVGLRVHDDKFEVVDDQTVGLQKGDRSDAYRVMYGRILNYLREKSIKHVVIKGSVVGAHRTALSHLLAAELRGVVTAAAAQSGAGVRVISKASISKNFGARKADEYVADDSFWDVTLDAQVRKGSRETALLILAARKQ